MLNLRLVLGASLVILTAACGNTDKSQLNSADAAQTEKEIKTLPSDEPAMSAAFKILMNHAASIEVQESDEIYGRKYVMLDELLTDSLLSHHGDTVATVINECEHVLSTDQLNCTLYIYTADTTEDESESSVRIKYKLNAIQGGNGHPSEQMTNLEIKVDIAG